MITAAQLTTAIRNVRAVTQEHEVEPDDYLGLSPEVDRSLRDVISGYVNDTGVPKSRRELHRILLRFAKIGIIIGLELAKSRVEEHQ